MVPLKHLQFFWRTLEVPLVSCQINLILTWSANCFIVANAIVSRARRFSITGAKRCVAVVTLSTQDNIKLYQLKSSFKITFTGINFNQKQQYRHKIKISIQVVNRLFVLLFKNNAHQTSYSRYYLPTIEVKNYVMIDGKNL